MSKEVITIHGTPMDVLKSKIGKSLDRIHTFMTKSRVKDSNNAPEHPSQQYMDAWDMAGAEKRKKDYPNKVFTRRN